MATTSSVRRARKDRPCGDLPTGCWITAGELYRRHVCFPGDDVVIGLTQPWVLDECQRCAADRGNPILPPPTTDKE